MSTLASRSGHIAFILREAQSYLRINACALSSISTNSKRTSDDSKANRDTSDNVSTYTGYTSALTIAENREKRKRVRIKKSLKTSNTALTTHLQSNVDEDTRELLKNVIPKKYVKVTVNMRQDSPNMVLLNEKVAEKMANIAKGDNVDSACRVVEINPGLGHLTQRLKETIGFKHIICLEEDPNVGERLSKFGADSVYAINYIGLVKLHYADKQDGGNRIATVLGLENNENKEENKPLYIFGIAPTVGFFDIMIRSLTQQRLFYDSAAYWNCHPQYYLTVSPSTYWILTSTPAHGFQVYRSSAVLFQLFFEMTVLDKFSRDDFLPWELNPVGLTLRSPIRKSFDPTIMYYLRLRSRKSTMDRLGKDNLFPFWYFVRHHLFARTNGVISELENWIPGCGIRLVKQGYSVYTQFGDLLPQQLLELFLEFISWPEFHDTSFMSAVEKFYSRLDVTDEEIAEFAGKQ